MDPFDKQLLSIIQRRFPVEPAPYSRIAAEMGCTEQDVLSRITDLKGERIIRQISAIFDPPAVGYRTCLVAMSVQKEHVQRAVEILDREQGISHNYLRDNNYNIWFTIAVPPGGDLWAETERLSSAVSARSSLILPALKMYKIAVVMNFGEEEIEPEKECAAFAGGRRDEVGAIPPQGDIDLIRCIQEDLPMTRRPFFTWAKSLLVEEEYLVDWIKSHLENGTIRRFAALLRHRNVGFLANAMVAWQCHEELIDKCGNMVASHPEITHCYQRTPLPDWPYNLYAMVHGRDRTDCDRVVEAMSKYDGLSHCKVLYTIKELKKERLKLFWGPIPSAEFGVRTAE
ncbi:MAG: hypothetical protein V1736_12085 [Pseudomonadota bacterium]